MKKAFLAIFVLTVAFSAPNIVKADSEDVMTEYLTYDFEDEGNNVIDKSGSANSTLFGRATMKEAPETDSKALYLNGRSQTFLQFPEGTFDNMDTMTITMDVYSEMGDENFFTFAIGQNTDKYIFLRTRGGQIRLAATTNSYGNEKAVVKSGRFSKRWVKVAMVFSPNELSLYVDGELADTIKNPGFKISDLGTDTKAYLGKSFYSGDAFFTGYIDNFKVYKEALTEAEIASLANIELKPFSDITLESGKLIGWKADNKNRSLTVYLQKNSSSADLGKLWFVTNDGVNVNGKGYVSLNSDYAERVTFIIEKEATEEKQDWTVNTVICGNPVISGQYADPDIDVFNGKYYMYCTTDGFSGWSGTKFHCFSSNNLTDWTDEGVILDVASNDVPWSVGSAWAPTIEEREGKYYFYFCAKLPDGNSSIGVAVADKPEGPYTAEELPLITKKLAVTNGIACGQAIDPSIFTDEDGESYLLFGNGYPTVVKLNPDMISVDWSTAKNYTGCKDFREAITCTNRDGIYHFTWSCDDTGSENYHVNYGTSKSIYGPIEFQYTILEKNPDEDILGTGHHCILQIPGEDEYYIAYHRFYTPLGFFTDGLGFHRETCIDKVSFDYNTGLMNVVIPTMEGVKERILPAGTGNYHPAETSAVISEDFAKESEVPSKVVSEIPTEAYANEEDLGNNTEAGKSSEKYNATSSGKKKAGALALIGTTTVALAGAVAYLIKKKK